MASENLNLVEKANEIENNLGSREFTLGKGLLQPFNESNSGTRKIMFGIHKEQSIQLCKPETPIILTGYENQYGYKSSGFVVADANYVVVDKIHKNKAKYLVLLYDANGNRLHSVVRMGYSYHTENYGYNVNTTFLDNLRKGSIVQKDDPLIISDSFDSAFNKQDGINLTTIYLNISLTTEDPIVLSESAAKKFTSPLFDSIDIIINDNDIALNLYGDDNEYKTFPDIGENVKNGILCAIRRERKDDEALYAQSKEHLKELMISDITYISDGEVIDIDVYCNNVEKLNDLYNSQLGKYYEENMEYCRQIVSTIDKFKKSHPGLELTYDTQKVYKISKDTINGVPYLKDKAFNNIYCQIITKTNTMVYKGDKITDRYGGKGVISRVLPDALMPHYYRFGEWHAVDAIYNSFTVNNRENPGQLYETEITYIGSKIVEAIANMWQSTEGIDDSYDNDYSIAVYRTVTTAESWIYTFLSILNSAEAEDYSENVLGRLSFDERKNYIWNVIQDQNIYVVLTPMRNIIDIDVLDKLYNAFPFIKNGPDFKDPNYFPLVCQKDSNGNLRYIHTRKPLVVGKKYIYRLKQIAKEKFSAVSLASTNIKGENTKTKANKMHITAIPKTPVRLGGMEAAELMQLPYCQYTIEAFMLLSTSPIARMLMEQLLIGDPFDRNITLDDKSKSRNVEIVNAYLKAMGLKLIFTRKPKRPNYPAKVIVAEQIPVSYYDTHVQIAEQIPDKIKPETFEKALKIAANVYYNNEGDLNNADNEETAMIEDAVIHLANIAKSNKDLLNKSKDALEYLKSKKIQIAYEVPAMVIPSDDDDDE